MNKELSSNTLITNIIAGIEKVKGTDITIMDLREVENTTISFYAMVHQTPKWQLFRALYRE